MKATEFRVPREGLWQNGKFKGELVKKPFLVINYTKHSLESCIDMKNQDKI